MGVKHVCSSLLLFISTFKSDDKKKLRWKHRSFKQDIACKKFILVVRLLIRDSYAGFQ